MKAVLLSTFVCLIKDELNNFYEVRGLLDVGANSNFMSKRLADKLNLRKEKTNISISGINNLSLNIKSKVCADIANRDKTFELNLEFLVVQKITEFTPSKPLEMCISSLNNIKLADEKFNLPGPIDLLLGAENFYELLRPGQIYPKPLNSKLVLQNSIFGYIVSGSLPAKSETNIYCGLVTDNLELEKSIKSFWEIETIEKDPEISKTKEAKLCEEHFLKNYSRSETGNYTVRMPLKEDPSCLGESKKKSLKCLNSLWNRLVREPKFCMLYKALYAKIFDPLGLIGPIITRAKVFMQNLWLLKIDWSDSLPLKENIEWNNFLTSLRIVNNISVPRCIFIEQSTSVELHGFADASELAYGAVIYVKSFNDLKESTVKLLTSKSRVAPLKQVTIPRLELCAAVLLTKLMKKVMSALKHEISNTYFWTDSTIVLSWLKKESKDLKTFVANRVSVIQSSTLTEQWHHVPSKQNPADLVSRGMDPIKIQQCDMWWFGPPFLQQPEPIECNDIVSNETDELFLQELKTPPVNQVYALINHIQSLDIISNCSSFTKLQRVVAWCKRFVHNAKNPLYPITGTLTSTELSQSLLCIVKNIQRTSFLKEIQCLEKGTIIPNNSKLLNLCPFLDSNGILRVGGRLKNANLPDTKKHPIILPPNHNFTYCIINYYHILYFHTGAETTLSLIRITFWIIAARNVIRKIIFKCMICKKISSKVSQQLMADLPAERVTPSRVFSRLGIDYCGPFQVKTFSGRSKQVKKVFICVFVCFSTKALHFEVVNDLTSAAFLAALKRFIARRGKPSDIFSDNGRNFVGANKELKEILKSLFRHESEVEINDYLANEGINWHFNPPPPSAPHFGGLWEASVKSLKYHLKRVVGKTILSYEEFLTLIIQIEAVLNSRPLCPLSNDPNDVEALTPAHFLIGSSLMALPESNYTEVPMNRLSRWQLVQKLTQNLWKKWSSEYLNKLLSRPKWYKGRVELKEGDLVLVKNTDNYCPLKWHLARVVKIHPGQDNIIRVVTLRDKFGTYKRPVAKIVPLPYVNENVL